MPLSGVISIMKQLFSIVNMLHSQSIAHRNIHPGHIMLQVKKGQYLLKLIDFSSSKNIKKLKTDDGFKDFKDKIYTLTPEITNNMMLFHIKEYISFYFKLYAKN